MSQGSPSTEVELGKFFLPEWVIGVFFDGHWEQVKEGTFQEGVDTDEGPLAVFEDPFGGEVIFVLAEITAYRIKKPPPPPEPQATVHQLHKKT